MKTKVPKRITAFESKQLTVFSFNVSLYRKPSCTAMIKHGEFIEAIDQKQWKITLNANDKLAVVKY